MRVKRSPADIDALLINSSAKHPGDLKSLLWENIR